MLVIYSLGNLFKTVFGYAEINMEFNGIILKN